MKNVNKALVAILVIANVGYLFMNMDVVIPQAIRHTSVSSTLDIENVLSEPDIMSKDLHPSTLDVILEYADIFSTVGLSIVDLFAGIYLINNEIKSKKINKKDEIV